MTKKAIIPSISPIACFIETDWKVVTEGLYEIEKRKILNDLMSPFEKQLNAMLKEFKTKYDAVLDQLTQVHGEDSQEVKSYKRSKKQLKTKFLEDNKPEGYVLWRTDESNRLFWGKSVSQSAIDKAIDQAQQNDNSGVGLAMKRSVCFVAASIRRQAISKYFGSSSIPVNFRPRLTAATPVVPDPMNGSRMV